ncbi:hypothetical protein PIB30_066033 [Stylosanthes scabra]|uniref:LysM domain receptor-like kinase 3 n=1 Tax=Stylosanthes scabra TaxID=79078 RepID=A0ABU6SN57_9FABA|nr:hypothetical protein [Stylosanthes scabra]
MSCTDTTRVCTSFLAFNPQQYQALPVIQSMFDVFPSDITLEGNGWDYVFIRKNCSCAANTKNYVSNTTFTVKFTHGGFVNDLVMDAYEGLALLPNTNHWASNGSVISLRLFCGCSSRLWNYLVSYVIRDGDSIESLASRFGVSMDSIEAVNGIDNSDNVIVGSLFYIPLNSIPGKPYHWNNDTPPVPVPSPSFDNFTADEVNHNANVVSGWIIGGLMVGIALIILSIILCTILTLRSSKCIAEARHEEKDDDERKASQKLHILGKPCFFCSSGGYMCGKCTLDQEQDDGESNNLQITISKPSTIGPDIFGMDKPIVLTYEEIFHSTNGFSDSNLLGHRTYGSVYYGLLRDQEVAIKRMKTRKTIESTMTELKAMCKVHHANLVEFIGYATSHDDEIFLIYEYAQKGSLRSHLHDPQNKGHSPLSWIMRVQIALDAARGLEYIHEHTKAHYVHQDITISNILLDASFRGKISDFGFSKLVAKRNDGEAATRKFATSYGYLAPEYLRDGLATTKSDVYAFGVVLFEIISGKEAVIRIEGVVTNNPERRPLASVMVSILRSTSRLRDNVDPNMVNLYPYDSVFKMAMLAKQCVEEEPILRPDMKQVVMSLSQILLSSAEWEATLAGKSQVFSGLILGR